MDTILAIWSYLTRDMAGYPVGLAWAWIPLVAAAAAAALKSQADSEQTSNQNKLADALHAYQSTKAGEGRAAIEKYTGGLTPEARSAERLGIQQELSQNYGAAVDRARGYEAPSDFAGRTPGRYNTVRSAGRARTDSRLKRAVSDLSVIGAPAQRDLRQSIRFGTAATDVDAANTASNALARAYAEAIRAQKPNAALSAGGQILGGYTAGGGTFGMGK